MHFLLTVTSFFNPFSTPTISLRGGSEIASRFLQVYKIALRTFCLASSFRSIKSIGKEIFLLNLTKNTPLRMTASKALLVAAYALIFVINFSSIKNVLKDLLFWLAEKLNPLISLSFLSFLFNTKSFDYKKRTLLHLAVIQGDLAATKTLLENKADINAQDYEGDTPLHTAIKTCNPELATLLLTKGALAEIGDNYGNTTLHTAAKHGAYLFTLLLINKHLNLLPLLNNKGNSPEHIAAENDHQSLLDYLHLKKKLGLRSTNSEGQTILHTAAKNHSYKTIIFLLEKGADPRDTDNEGNTSFHLLFESPTWHSLSSKNENDPFLEIVKIFLRKGVNPLLSNKKGDTPLSSATRILSQDLRVQYLKALSSYLTGSPSSAPIQIGNPEEDLNIAEPSHQKLLETTDRRKIKRQPLLELARLNQDLSDKEGLEGIDDHGNTPLHIAVQHNSLITIESLLQAKVSLDPTNEFGDTPLHLAVRDNKLSLVIKLTQARADIHIQNKRGNTALHIAAKYHFVEIIAFLLKNQANLGIKNEEEKTPEDLASCSLQDLVNSRLKQVREAVKPSSSKITYSPLRS